MSKIEVNYTTIRYNITVGGGACNYFRCTRCNLGRYGGSVALASGASQIRFW